MKKTLLFLFVFICLFISSYAQSPAWQWGIRGGGLGVDGDGTIDDNVIDMATDQDGNVYVLSAIYAPGVDIDGHASPSYGASGGSPASAQNIAISSFKCDGAYRWTKVIGNASYVGACAIRTDTLGGVYVAGSLSGGYIMTYLGADSTSVDTSWLNTDNQMIFTVKFDTAGNYKWLRLPQPDTASIRTINDNYVYDMDADGAGNTYSLCLLSPGAYADGGYIVTAQGYYMLHYNASGGFVAGTPMDITNTGTANWALSMRRDPNNGRYYITSQNNEGILYGISFGGAPLAHTLFIGCFSSSGALLWLRQDTSIYGGCFGRAAVDNEDNIYLAGTYFGADEFNGYAIAGTLGANQAPFVVKLDTTGANVWAINASTSAGTQCYSIILNGGEADVTGGYPGELKWPGYADSLYIPFSSTSGAYETFITRFDRATGAVTGMDSIATDLGTFSEPNAIAADSRGNFYIGGNFSSQLYLSTAGGIDTFTSIGGISDFFVTRYGLANCTCTLPTAAFTHTSGGHTISYTYTGTTAALDSVVWSFGDGGSSATLSPTHTYTAAGTYTVCVTAYTGCGSDSSCSTVTVAATGVGNPAAMADVAVYPNPVSGQLIIDNAAAGTAIRLLNMIGQEVYTGTITGDRQTINTTALPPGLYLLQLTGTNGERATKTIVKQ